MNESTVFLTETKNDFTHALFGSIGTNTNCLNTRETSRHSCNNEVKITYPRSRIVLTSLGILVPSCIICENFVGTFVPRPEQFITLQLQGLQIRRVVTGRITHATRLLFALTRDAHGKTVTTGSTIVPRSSFSLESPGAHKAAAFDV